MKKDSEKTRKATPKAPQKIFVREAATFKDLAEKIKKPTKAFLKKAGKKGFHIEINDPVDEEILDFLAKETGLQFELISVEKEMKVAAESRKEDLEPRPPVVTIMGHVNHGKTTLLDALRASNLVEKEAGGITQHIGAYRVTSKNRSITFIDTPGHEAFTLLRARGAKITDIVVLVVAAEEGVMPQTREAINHARAAGVPIIVAINKIDKPEANVDRVKQQLSKEGLMVEDWGGDVVSVNISAKDKTNLDELLEMILLLSDVIDIKANPKVNAQGVILEARLDAKKGPSATVIIQHGTLRQGEPFLSGTTLGKVRAFFDEFGKPLKGAGPSIPVEVLGFSRVPAAGDFFQVTPDLETAKTIVQYRLSIQKKEEPQRPVHITLDDLFKKIEEGEIKSLPILIRADVQGSVEVLQGLLPSLSSNKVKIEIIHAATGNITESDVLLASASNAVILGYHIKPSQKILETARRENVEIRTYDVIYHLTEDIKKALAGLLEPVKKEIYLGRAEIRKVFQVSRIGNVAGCLVVDGKITRNAEVRLIRNKEIIHQGRISSLKRLKDTVTEVKKEYECGIALEKFKDIQEGDVIEAFLTERIKPE